MLISTNCFFKILKGDSIHAETVWYLYSFYSFLLVLAVIGALLLSACVSSTNPVSSGENQENGNPESKRIGLVMKTLSNPFFSAMEEGANS